MALPAKAYGTLLTFVLAVAGLGTQAYAAPRAVLELFTSQGCSSCPPADELFAEMKDDPDLITLSLPVDYWDRLGWKDTYAKHAFTERQHAYAGVRGDGRVYTPQAVVNGVAHAVGSRRGAIGAAVAKTQAGLNVPVDIKRDGSSLVVSVGESADRSLGRGQVILMPYLDARDVEIGRGENARRTVTYTNIVRDIAVLTSWSGTPIARTIPLGDLESYDGVVVLLQAGSPGKPGAILGAGRLTLR